MTDNRRQDRIARQRAIGVELRRVFGPLVEEPVPENLRKLAEKLDERLALDAADAASAPSDETQKN